MCEYSVTCVDHQMNCVSAQVLCEYLCVSMHMFVLVCECMCMCEYMFVQCSSYRLNIS